MLNPNFLLTHRNKYSEGTDNAQKTPLGHLEFNSYVKILRVFIFQTDRQTDGWTDGEIDQITTRKKRYSHLAIGWNVWGFHELGLFWRVPQSNYNQKKVQSSGHWLQCRIVLAGSSLYFLTDSSIKLQIRTKKKVLSPGHWLECCLYLKWGFLDQITNYDWKRYSRPSYSSIAYTISNTRNILFLLCLYLKQGNKLNGGIVWFEGKASSWTSKTCLTMLEPFAGPSSIAMGNQPMPSRYPLHKRLSKGGVQGFMLTLWSGGEMFFLVNTLILY